MIGDIDKFLTASAFAVVGASTDRNKYGNKVLRCYVQNKKRVFPVNPNETIIEGLECVHHIADLPNEVESISVITPPAITEKVVMEAIAKGIKNIWMQPGAESDAAIAMGEKHHVNMIGKGACILVTLGYHE